MGWLVAASVLGLAACQLVFPLDGPDQSASDADPGDALQGEPACFDGFLDLCTQSAVPSTREFDGGVVELDTTDGQICTPLAMTSQSDLCAIVAGTIRITSGTSVRVVGVRPFALVAVDGLRIEGRLDVAGHTDSMQLAAGAPNLACNVGTLPVLQGGGAGGSFGTVGGGGGNNPGNTSVRPGIAGAIVSPPAMLRAGCPGQDGGLDTPSGSTTLVDAGAAGGAVYLRSIGPLEISGIVNASGGAGLGGHGLTTPNEGGGGGGSGGMIVIEAETFAFSGQVFANGGGGGEGGAPLGNGDPGIEPRAPAIPALGGGGSTFDGGDGGVGGYSDTAASAGSPGQSQGAGGGGGGGQGYIYLIPPASFQLDVMSPAGSSPP